jgi:hypothetical protein
VIVTAPPDALIRDPACAGDLWLANPNAANLRLETFSARPWIRNPAEAKRFAELMLRARHLEDQWGSKRRRNAEGLPPLVEQDEPPASRRDRGPRYGNAAPAITRPDLGQPLT